jgi:methionine-R-sulfoxide reductase
MLNWNDVIKSANHGNPTPDRRVEKTAAAWKAQLTPDQYRITREKGTEARFSGGHCSIYEPGLYDCTCCGTDLFDTSEQFDSGTGWPSFAGPVKENAIKYHQDRSWGMTRVEVMCNTCDSHLGHVFPDGPAPSGLRYCINSISLTQKD